MFASEPGFKFYNERRIVMDLDDTNKNIADSNFKKLRPEVEKLIDTHIEDMTGTPEV